MRKEKVLELELEACFYVAKEKLLKLFKENRGKIDSCRIWGWIDWNREDNMPEIKCTRDLDKRNLKEFWFGINIDKKMKKELRKHKSDKPRVRK